MTLQMCHGFLEKDEPLFSPTVISGGNMHMLRQQGGPARKPDVF